MMQTVQLSIADGQYAATVREALSRSCAWHVESVDHPDPSQHCVMVLDEPAFARLPLPLSNPERVVLITRKDPRLSIGAGLGGRHRLRGLRRGSHQHGSARDHGGGFACCKIPRSGSERNIPHFHLRICANSPTRPDIPDQNVAKPNRLARRHGLRRALPSFRERRS